MNIIVKKCRLAYVFIDKNALKGQYYEILHKLSKYLSIICLIPN